jgi:hypothetical protein
MRLRRVDICSRYENCSSYLFCSLLPCIVYRVLYKFFHNGVKWWNLHSDQDRNDRVYAFGIASIRGL